MHKVLVFDTCIENSITPLGQVNILVYLIMSLLEVLWKCIYYISLYAKGIITAVDPNYAQEVVLHPKYCSAIGIEKEKYWSALAPEPYYYTSLWTTRNAIYQGVMH